MKVILTPFQLLWKIVSFVLRIFTTKFYLYLTMILVQLVYLVVMSLWLTSAGWVSAVGVGITWIMVFVILNRDENLNYKVAWIILILMVPTVGGILYLIMGNKRPAFWLRRKLRPGKKKMAQTMTSDAEVSSRILKPSLISRRYLEYMDFPVYQNTRAQYYELGDYNYYDLLKDLSGAKKFIFIEYFIVSEGIMMETIMKILAQKVREGVDVRLIYDDFGSFAQLPYHFKKKLTDAGIKYVSFNKFVPFFFVSQNYRDHRKICVIDGSIGYSGGLNLADEYINAKERFGHWKDAGVRIEGEAVWTLTALFLSTFYAYHPEMMGEDTEQFRPEDKDYGADGYVLPYADDPLDDEDVGENVYYNLITHARSEICIMTPYFIIDDTMMKALHLAVANGVRVKLFTPHIPDKKIVFRVTRSYYYDLIAKGVEVYEYTPGFLHSKVVMADNQAAVVGTINFDYRSFYLHFENAVLLYRCDKALRQIRRDFEALEKKSTLVGLNASKAYRGPVEAFLNFLSPLM